ncbi:phosphonate ABC transporter, permease protein PhnE [Leuconostoc gelidum]|uniref:Phosphonate ABC transporter, permease protein PhnE n=1 Tax=Leuconostoc gelidum subsp. gelidum TaxID=1607839 RepID=A0AB35FW92_LEUGE|nr:phosphonate ABC transporter, permease protein PhnE [Leuconostoc gelidum]AFS41119.1 phosphonate ABC transporter permease [Leuconostoc gelidum JB7]MBZ5963957.1 phosphonate ABC transporter, permease protein PhnE [Leuconostoc gelidum subsp. gelidum]MBZ5974302.1 phosphonate ABC transporter, permease protein PhnE [Leuconostoc gelidum subsp. gelidum]MBZ5975989.1 phosphonate ABC transporter, permease protein PhnE [Leuconostoc gelidum subsp. gelidum]MBZ5985838.1 phosphonate ABC transporter, permease
MNKKLETVLSKEPSRRVQYSITGAILLILLVSSSPALGGANMTSKGFEIGWNILTGIFTPDTSLLFGLGDSGVAYLILQTIAIAFLGTLVGAVIAVPLSFISATNIVPRPVVLVTRFIIMAIRTVPSLVYGLMFIRVTGPGPFAGVMTLAIVSIGMISKLFIETIEDLDTGILESLDAFGSTLFQKIRYGILPQLGSDFISILVYRFDMNLREATILGLVGAGGIGAPMIFALSAYHWHQVGAILIGLFLLVFIVEILSDKLRQKILHG